MEQFIVGKFPKSNTILTAARVINTFNVPSALTLFTRTVAGDTTVPTSPTAAQLSYTTVLGSIICNASATYLSGRDADIRYLKWYVNEKDSSDADSILPTTTPEAILDPAATFTYSPDTAETKWYDILCLAEDIAGNYIKVYTTPQISNITVEKLTKETFTDEKIGGWLITDTQFKDDDSSIILDSETKKITLIGTNTAIEIEIESTGYYAQVEISKNLVFGGSSGQALARFTGAKLTDYNYGYVNLFGYDDNYLGGLGTSTRAYLGADSNSNPILDFYNYVDSKGASVFLDLDYHTLTIRASDNERIYIERSHLSIEENKRFYLEATDSATGDTYMRYSSANSRIEFTVNGILEGYIDTNGFVST